MNEIKSDLQKSAYQEAGVNVALADKLIQSWQSSFDRTARKERIKSPMGFSGLFQVPQGYDAPVLVSSTDGVGTKLKLAIELNRHDTIGIDLVAMCVNDIIVSGAEPLFFLDYFACGKLDASISSQVMNGIVTGCEIAHADLIGGETSEMPGMYVDGEYDLAGFCVGIVEKSKILDGTEISEGDVIVGLASNGFHSNGYSLIRKVIADQKIHLSTKIGGQTLGDLLMIPTQIYTRTLLDAISKVKVRAFAHITGGGIAANLVRIIPDHLSAIVLQHSWKRAPIFNWIQNVGNLSNESMFETFNCGVGMIAVLPADSESPFRAAVESNGIETETIGAIHQALDKTKVVIE